MIKVYFDENTSPYIARALDLLESNKRQIQVFHTKDAFKQGESDQEIVRKVHENKGVLFSQDDDFKKSQEVVEAMKQYPIGFFYLRQPKRCSYWDLVRIYTKSWLEARDPILKNRTPYYYEIMSRGNIKKR